MYTIEYYKTKKTFEEPKNSKNLRIKHLISNKDYDKNLVEKCLNIKSLTIDLEDIKYAMLDRKLRRLPGLYALINRIPTNDVNAITILNNNFYNSLLIYEILNCKWMINRDEEINNTDALNIINRYVYLTEIYNNIDDSSKKAKIKNEMILIKYYIYAIINKNDDIQINETSYNTLKLGNRIIR